MKLRATSIATLAGLLPHYLCFYILGTPLWTERIAEWIMAHTPSYLAVLALGTLGDWAKPFAMTGALATLGGALLAVLAVSAFHRYLILFAGPVLALTLGTFFDYHSLAGQCSFWAPALAILYLSRGNAPLVPERRKFLAASLQMAMGGGVIAVAGESFLRDRALAKRAVEPVDLFPFPRPSTTFGDGFTRKSVTPVNEFYGMSKNTVDPAIAPPVWRLHVTVDGRLVKEYTFSELLTLPRQERYVTLRCVSNTLKSDLMGTALWSGIRLSQLVNRASLHPATTEAAIIGVDGHGDSLTLDYAFSDNVMLALGMNGRTLNRIHGFPIRLLAPRYYGFKNVKWISEIAFVTAPYFGTWPKMGYTKEPRVHVASHIDRLERQGERIEAGGVSFAGDRGIRAVEVRTDVTSWTAATLESPLSGDTWTRWRVSLSAAGATQLQARAQDGEGHWQEETEGPLFPDGVTGPTIRRFSS